jgi:hypothetical protein
MTDDPKLPKPVEDALEDVAFWHQSHADTIAAWARETLRERDTARSQVHDLMSALTAVGESMRIEAERVKAVADELRARGLDDLADALTTPRR